MGYSSLAIAKRWKLTGIFATSMRKITDAKRMMVCGGAATHLTWKQLKGERNNVRFQWMEI
jgi:hypothetical protein